MLFATWRVVQMKYPLALPGLAAARERAHFTGLIAGHLELMESLVAAHANDASAIGQLGAISGIGGENSAMRVEYNMGLGRSIEQGHQLGNRLVRRFHDKSIENVTHDGMRCHLLPGTATHCQIDAFGSTHTFRNCKTKTQVLVLQRILQNP